MNPEGRTYQFPLGKLRALLRRARKAGGQKISPRSQRRDDQRPEQAKRARPGEARHGVECLARMSGVGRREADASGGISPW